MPIIFAVNSVQLFGVALVTIGLILLIVFPVFGVFDEMFFEYSFFGGWALCIIGAVVLVVSLVLERMNDIKNEKFKNY